MRFLLDLLTRLPLPVLYGIGRGVFVIAFHGVRWRRTIAADNLAITFPDKTPAERSRLLRQAYLNLCDVLAETIWAYGASASALLERVTIVNPEAVVQPIRNGQSVLLLAGHFCNWEWLLLAAGAALGVPVDAVYKPPRQRVFDEFLRHGRSRFGGNPVAYRDFVAEIMKRRGTPRCYAMVADQTPIAEDEKYWTQFLGRDTAFYVGADTIARIVKGPVFFVAMQREGRGRYRVQVVPLAAPPYESGGKHSVVEHYVHLLEAEILQSPADWLWIHRKWKYAKPVYG
jgi:Kdo2-lipid IVA lauroyltransferase/acyltransferase